MKIAIVGTRGIPNAYGGFEQFAEYLGIGLVERGHEVTVYSPHYHAYRESTYRGVRLVRKYNPESLLGGGANLLYDYFCLVDAVLSKQDIILACGAGAVFPSHLLPLGRSRLVTNMDGIEWKRTKWNRWTNLLVRWMEARAAKRSHRMVADNEGIRTYLREVYDQGSTFIPYGAEVVGELDPAPLGALGLASLGYSMLVARLEPENSIEMILEGHVASGRKDPFLVVGNADTPFGNHLKARFGEGSGVRFLGGIYDKDLLDVLRQHARWYLHGHTVGGTNPSLLEAMACGARILAHDNEFNRSVAREGAAYFASAEAIAALLQGEARPEGAALNRERIRATYSWASIVTQYEDLFTQLVRRQGDR